MTDEEIIKFFDEIITFLNTTPKSLKFLSCYFYIDIFFNYNYKYNSKSILLATEAFYERYEIKYKDNDLQKILKQIQKQYIIEYSKVNNDVETCEKFKITNAELVLIKLRS